MPNYVSTIESRDGTEYELRASVASITASAVTLGSDEQPTVSASVADDSSISFAFGIPAGDASASQAAAATALAAATSATNAAASANSAATSATNAATSATNAATSANSAAESASSAATSATSLSNAAITACETATTNANAATTSANDAATAATTAANTANTATSAATAATTAANTAATEAGNLELAMDASGNVTVTNSAGTSTTNTAIPDAVALATSATSAANSAAGSANDAANTAQGFITTLQGYLPLDSSNILHEQTSKAALASVDDAWPSALLGLTAYGTSTQDGTPTPDAPVEIKSVNAASVRIIGDDLKDTQTGGKYLDSTGAEVEAQGWAYTDYIDISESTSFALSEAGAISGSSPKCCVYDASKNFLAAYPGNKNPSFVKTFNITETAAKYMRLSKTLTSSVWHIKATYPLTLTDSNGVAHVLRSLPDGTADTLVLAEDGTGVLTENVVEVDLASLTWTVTTGVTGAYYARLLDGGYPTPYDIAYSAQMCSAYPITSYWASSDLPDKSIRMGNSVETPLIRSKNTDYTTLETFTASLSGQKFYYRRATPATYTIPAVNMPTLPATVSNAWLSATDEDSVAIAADIAIDYRQDVCVVRDQLEARIAALESA